METELEAGAGGRWALIERSQRLHFIIDCRSLCDRWKVFQHSGRLVVLRRDRGIYRPRPYHVEFVADDGSPEKCDRCSEMLAMKMSH